MCVERNILSSYLCIITIFDGTHARFQRFQSFVRHPFPLLRGRLQKTRLKSSVRTKRLLLNIFGTILIKDTIERAPRSWSYVNDSVLSLLVCSSVEYGPYEERRRETKDSTNKNGKSKRKDHPREDSSEKPNDVSAGHIPNCTYP